MHRLILIILLLAFLVACRDAPGPDAIDTAPAVTQTEQVKITLAVDGSSLNRYRPLLEAFGEENPHIRVRLVNTGEVADPDESGIRALATSFDVFPYSPNRQGETQYLLDLRPLLVLDPQFDTADFLPGLLPPTTEPLWAIPTGAAYYLTFFDKSAFDEAGRPYPDLDWTSDDFLDAALALTVREGDDVTRWGYVPGQMRYPPLLAGQLAAPLTTPDGGLRLADPDVVAAVQWLGDLFTVHEVTPWLDEYKPADQREGGGPSPAGLIGDNRAAMWHWTHLLYDNNNERVGVTAVPQGENGLAGEPLIYGFGISRGTASPEAAWELLDFLSRQPPQVSSPFSTGPVPARQSVAAAANYWEQLPADLAPALQYTAENSAAPRISFQATNLLQEAMAAHIDDGIPVAAALGQLPAADIPPESEVEVVVVPTLPVEDDEETIRITFATDFGILEAHRRLSGQFQEEHPDITIQMVNKDYFASNVLDRVGGSDCFVGEPGFWQDDEVRAALLPLTPLLELDGDLHPDDFYPALMEPLLVNGELWGIPAWMNAPYLEFNRRLFAEAGIPDPPLDWTLDDFLDIARQLATGDGETKQYGYAEFAPMFWLGFLPAFGVDVVDSSAAVPDFNYEAAAEMIAWHVDLVRSHQGQPLIGTMIAPNMDEFQALLRSGRLAMWHAGGSASAFMRTGVPLNFDVGIAAQPIGPGGYRGNMQQITPTAYHIVHTAGSAQRQACWEWIKFLAAQPTAVQVQTGTSSARMMPAHIQAAESDAYVSLVGEELAAVFQDFLNFPAVPDSPAMPQSPPWMRPGHDWLRDAYWEAVTGEISVAAALAEAETKFSQYRQCIIERDGFDDPAAWSACRAEAER